MKEEIALDDGYRCEHCGTRVGVFENHDCYMKHLHKQLESKRTRRKKKK